MTDTAKLALLRAMVGMSNEEDWTDEILQQYLLIAGIKIINRAFPYSNDITEVPARYNVLQCEIAAYLLNKRGAEGETSHSENGISRSYESADVPPSMLREVIPHCGILGGVNNEMSDKE